MYEMTYIVLPWDRRGLMDYRRISCYPVAYPADGFTVPGVRRLEILECLITKA